MKLKFKRKPEKAKKIVFGTKHKYVKPTRKIKPKSISILYPINANKPVKRYWGDYDKDGVINGLDCAPRNPKKQGEWHEDDRYYGEEIEETEEARKKLSKIKTRVAKDNYIRKMAKKGIYI